VWRIQSHTTRQASKTKEMKYNNKKLTNVILYRLWEKEYTWRHHTCFFHLLEEATYLLEGWEQVFFLFFWIRGNFRLNAHVPFFIAFEDFLVLLNWGFLLLELVIFELIFLEFLKKKRNRFFKKLFTLWYVNSSN
jgi:hypothetical protein